MYDDIVLPVRSKFRIPSSRSRTQIYFIRDTTKKSLFILKWIELVLCFLCLTFAILVSYTTNILRINEILTLTVSSTAVLMVNGEISYSYFKRSLPLAVQATINGACFTGYSLVTVILYRTQNSHELNTALFFLNGLTAVIFLVDFVCKIIISTYLYQTTRVRSVIDVGVSAFIPPLPLIKSKPHRSILTATPITYGGTFPVGKNQHPFVPEDKSPNEPRGTPDRPTRNKTVQTYLENKNAFSDQEYAFDQLTKTKIIETYLEQQEKANSLVPILQIDEERRKKSLWTCSTPTTSRKVEARRQASMSTPITYSGTFAVNKELVPFTPELKKTSPRAHLILDKCNKRREASSKSEGNSPRREVAFDLGKLDQISEERSQISSESCSLKRSKCGLLEHEDLFASILPGSVMDDEEETGRKIIRFNSHS